MLASQKSIYISEAEYLEGEKQAEVRHEYVNGRVYAMAGASKRHNRIARNFITRMESVADETGCEVFFSDIKVRSTQQKTYYYPDVVVSCEISDDEDEYYLEKPCLIIEVTSATTLRKDYLEKTLSYQAIPSLQAYLIVAQDKPQIDMLVRNPEGIWGLQQYDDPDDELVMPCLNLSVKLVEVYRGVKLGAA